jgi:hypothetical protein
VSKADFSDDTKGHARRRQGGMCQMCRALPVAQFHHRKLRRHGDNSPENCLALCVKCHHDIHNKRIDFAYRHGLLLKSWDDPATVGVWLDCLSTCYLDHVS